MSQNSAVTSSPLAQATRLAQSGRFSEMQAICRQRLADADLGAAEALDIGALFLAHGFLADARACFEHAQTLLPRDLPLQANLANVMRDLGQHDEARRIYDRLHADVPDHPVIRRNALTNLEYDPAASDADRLAQARQWGAWAERRAGGPHPRPPCAPLAGRPLRIGYVSADLCQHTVGLFLKHVIRAHDPARVQVFCYSAGQVKDWVTDAIAACTTLRPVATLDDAALAAQIRADAIDVLVDLSGHTGGSRLTAFAYRPAPVMVSWLGYFATTGLACIDAVLLDAWHAPPGAEAHFAEPILRLPSRFCYQPLPGAPLNVMPPPCQRNGHITFGSFNNTAKYHPQLFDLWAQILSRVLDSRLILKWRTFNDAAFRQQVMARFAERGIDPLRIELRGPSPHIALFKEYADIDIALDPFPFSGGLTSCEALWMGVPVITLPQSRVVSRQTHAFLNLTGLPELAARDAADYLRIATELAQDQPRLNALRTTLREKMQASPLMDVSGFTRTLENELINLYHRICLSDRSQTLLLNDQ